MQAARQRLRTIRQAGLHVVAFACLMLKQAAMLAAGS
jgi:hypothetical protein